MFIKTGDNQEALDWIITEFEQNWIVGLDYREENPISFKGKELSEDIKRDAFFQKNIFYIRKLYSFISYEEDGEELPIFAKKEITRWEHNGGQCIYLSALLYSLLLHDKVADAASMCLCQGYYNHMCREDNLLGMMMGKEHRGLHAWLELNEAVIDISIRQEENFFDFKGRPIILGEVPEGLSLIGYKETHKTAKDYGRTIAREGGTVYLEWIKDHSLAASRLFLDFMKRKK